MTSLPPICMLYRLYITVTCFNSNTVSVCMLIFESDRGLRLHYLHHEYALLKVMLECLSVVIAFHGMARVIPAYLTLSYLLCDVFDCVTALPACHQIGAAARDASWDTSIMSSLLRSARVEDAATAAAAIATATATAYRHPAAVGATGAFHTRQTSPSVHSADHSDAGPSRDLLGPSRVPIILRKDIATSELISSGGFSNILKGQWCGCNIAMKILPCNETTFASSWTVLEAELIALHRLRHPRVLTYKGLCRNLLPCEGKVGLVMEYVERGSLYNILHGTNTSFSSISNCGRLRIAADIVEGMRFLHQSCIVHSNLKSSSVFIDSDGRAKVANFGLSHFRQQAARHGGSSMGTVAWNAPEVISGGSGVEYSSDVYSFGVIMWELWTGSVPWEGQTAYEMMTAVVHGKRLAIPESCSDAHPTVARIADECMGAEDTRPTFTRLHSELGDHLKAAVGARASALPSTNTTTPFPLRYICPIGYEVMVDPVVCADGHTYERSNIERWLKQSNRSPKTNLSLRNTELFPNLALKEAIEEAVLGGDFRRSTIATNDEDY